MSVTGRPTSRVSVRLSTGKMVVEVKQSDMLPATDDDVSKGRAAQSKKKDAVRALRAEAAAQRAKGGNEGVALTVQTSANTVDVRGCRAAEAEAEVEAAIAAARAGQLQCLFVVHGLGTGELRRAVRAYLRDHKRVARVQEEPDSKGGCTMVFLK